MSSDETAVMPAPAEDVPGKEPNTGRYVLLGSATLAIAALIVAAIFGIQWWVSSGNGNLSLAQNRDDVSKTTAQAVRAFIAVDYTNVDQYFQQQLAISDNDLAGQLKGNQQNYRQAIIDAKTKVTDVNVMDVGVEELNTHDGKANALAAVSYVVNRDGQQPAPKMQRLELQLTKVGDAWKLSSIGSVPTVAGS
ncbi:hypothetical protein HFP15_26250 [Amycolatopsis sp. K13G38]|uniref:Mce-associated membrane protein n=1 Tax=Amycolatopsis acididurans TaxID=2724524 RepID=A0ABX1J9B3_9PSEU|nr:hypothetical protein [Amycolatopsis acididurans]NKQ56385.1 hypothetical protein [Amycolatopsis acididurans]